jgi:hypothetical protein
MFGKAERDLTRTLSEMEYEARTKCNYNQTEARQRMAQWLADDRRFDNYDHARLIERVHLNKSNGAVLELDDPQLLKGGAPRPGDRHW